MSLNYEPIQSSGFALCGHRYFKNLWGFSALLPFLAALDRADGTYQKLISETWDISWKNAWCYWYSCQTEGVQWAVFLASDKLQLVCGVLDKVSATSSQEHGFHLSGETMFVYHCCLLLYVCPSELYQQEGDLQWDWEGESTCPISGTCLIITF